MVPFDDRACRPNNRVLTRAEPAVNADGLALEPLRGLTSTVSPDPMVLATTLAGAASAIARLDLLYARESTWFEARRAVAGRRKDSNDARAVDVLAAAPVLSAT